MWDLLADGLKLVIWTVFVLLLGILLGYAATGRSLVHPDRHPPETETSTTVAARVLPAVVSVEVKRWISHPPVEGLEIADTPLDHIPVPASGSGFLFDHQGHVLTNDHVVRGAADIWIHLHDGRQYRADVVGSDPETDVAVLSLRDAPPLPVLALGRSEFLEIGEWVAAVGNPLGHLSESFTVGVVSGVGRHEIAIRGGAPTYQDFIQTDAAIQFGNSGGPLVNRNGEVIGVNTAFGGSGSGIGFAIPIDLAGKVAEALIDDGPLVRGYLGVMLQEVDPDLARALSMERIEGALVREVFADTPAAAAGIGAGDVIVSFGGKPVQDVGGLRLLVADAAVGETVPLGVYRFGQDLSLHVTLSERPEFDVTPDLGHSFEAPPPREFGLFVSAVAVSATTAVRVDSIASGSLAAAAGLVPGDLILELDGEAILSVDELDRGLERARAAARPAAVRADRDGDSWYLALATPES
ncbi:MAG: trypsin-like peptidase domain-containing protein [Candidatus Eisenbacteria bacterium]|uniref:Trypsin-like peptidase domain-containing protein n=1 Tax=Eiseniibacteriota bacterium TaxID=2212470 RepID=A0A956LZF6_UNCEI|nr:trypsin-like peptidase domain-containing protein [Candidatus Eisenbacteria bacterium]